MKTRISEKQLRRFHRLLSVKMIDFDCGEICSPENKGIPKCCENEFVVPVLFRDEFKWHRKNGKFWKRMPPKTKEIRTFIEESETYYVFSQCAGPKNCLRSKRSFNCMIFPFEPYISRDGDIMGLMYAEGDKDTCPLIGKPAKTFNPAYIANSIKFWQELFELYPEEKEMYMEESRKRERKAKRKGKRFRILRSRT
jgi:hypothetical protein